MNHCYNKSKSVQILHSSCIPSGLDVGRVKIIVFAVSYRETDKLFVKLGIYSSMLN